MTVGDRVGASVASWSATTRGILWMVLTGFCFLAVTVSVRYIGPRIPAAEAAFIRYLAGTLMLLPVFLRLWRGSVKIRSANLLIWRGVAHGFGVILWFFAMARIPIAEVTALGYLSPIIVTIGAAMFLGEKLHFRRIAAVLVGFAGVMIILRPGFDTISIGQIAQLATAPLFAASFLLAKKLTAREDVTVIVAALSLICTLTLLPPALLDWVQPTLWEVAMLTLTAVFATLGHYTMTRAFRLAPLAVLQPISFLQLVWATLCGIVLFGEPVDSFVVLGGLVLILSTTYIAHRESVVSRRSEGESS
jgi:drug/metabolite transporter (DMT)-like permease